MSQHDERQRETPPYGPPPPAVDPSRGPGPGARRGRAALLLAMPGLVLSLLYFPLGLVLDVAAIVTGVRALRAARRHGARPTSAVWGVTLASLGVVIVAGVVAVYAAFWNEVNGYRECTSGANTIEAQRNCDLSLEKALERRLGVDVRMPLDISSLGR